MIAQKKVIEALKRSREGATPASGAAGKADGAASAGKRSVSNPVYEQLKVRLAEADTAVASLQRQRVAEAELLDRLEKLRREQPGLVAEYQNMDRDYNVLRKSYEELLNRLQAANLAQAADTQVDKVKLQIVDPPETPRLPVTPNRIMLVSGVLVAGIGGGIVFTILLGQLDRSFSTVDQLRELGLPVLGGISILGQPALLQRMLVVARFTAAVVALVGVYRGTDGVYPARGSADLDGGSQVCAFGRTGGRAAAGGRRARGFCGATAPPGPCEAATVRQPGVGSTRYVR